MLLSLRILVLTLVTFYSTRVFSQKHTYHAFKVNIPLLFVKFWNIQYEIGLTQNRSIGISWSSVNDSYIFADTEATGNLVTLDYRLRIKERRQSSLYLSAFARYQNIIYEGNEDRVKLNTVGGGVMIGKEWIVTSRFLIDIYGGFNYFLDNYKVLKTDGVIDIVIPNSLRGLGPRIGVSLGLRL